MIRKKPSAANMITQRLDTPDHRKPRWHWYDISLEHLNRDQQGRAKQKAEEDAKQQAEEAAAMSTPDLIRETLTATNRDTMPLNGSRVLTAALAGGSGSVNGHARDSVASLIRQGLITSVQEGRSE